MKEFDYTIKDALGIHARPAGYLVKLMQGLQSEVTMEANGKSANGKRLIAVMSLGVKQNHTVKFKVSGEDEEAAETKIKEFLEQNL